MKNVIENGVLPKNVTEKKISKKKRFKITIKFHVLKEITSSSLFKGKKKKRIMEMTWTLTYF